MPGASLLEEMLLKVSGLVHENPEIEGLELFPVYAYREQVLVFRSKDRVEGKGKGLMHKLERIFNPRSVAVVGSKQVDNHNWLRTVLPFQGPKYTST